MTAAETAETGRAAPVSFAGLIVCLLLTGLTAAVFLAWPELDLIAQGYFYRADTGFFLAHSFFADIFYVGIREFGMVVATFVIAVIVYAVSARVRPLGRHWRGFALVTLVFVVGPGIVVNTIFKDNWGRARPSYVVEFGGTKKFTPPLVITDQCERNCSFVAGHPSMLFAGFALVLAMRRRRALGYAAVLALGGMAGLGRIMEGGHFLSDVIFAGLFVYLVAWLWHFLLYRWLLPERLARWGPGRWAVRYFVEHPWRAGTAVRFMRRPAGLALVAGLAVAVLAIVNLGSWDRTIAQLFKAHDSSVGTAIFRVITQFGGSAPWLIASAAVGGFFLLRWRRTHAAADRFNALRAGFVFLAVALPSLLNNALKFAFGRSRPRVWFRDETYVFDPFRWDPTGNYWSMPSGHTSVAFGLATALALLWPRWWRVWLAYAVAVGASRVIVTAHWFSDVVVGAYISVVVVVALKWAVERRGVDLFGDANSCYQRLTERTPDHAKSVSGAPRTP